MDMTGVIAIVVGSCVLGIIWAVFNVILVRKIDVAGGSDGDSDSMLNDIPQNQKELILELGEKISTVLR